MEDMSKEPKRDHSYPKLQQMNSDSDISVKISHSKSKEVITTTVPSKKVNQRILEGKQKQASDSQSIPQNNGL